MKRVFVILCLFVFLFYSSSFSESYSTYSTGHFVFQTPAGWIAESKNNLLHIESPDGINGGLIITGEILCTIEDQDLRKFYDGFVTGVSESENVLNLSVENIVVAEADAILLSYDSIFSNTTLRQYCIACYHEGVFLSFTFSDISLDNENAYKRILDYAKSFEFVSLSNSEKIENAARLVYGDTLIASRAGKYPTIDIREYGSAIEIKSATNQKAFSFFKLIRKYRDSIGLDFLDIRINVYTNVMDVYGNTSEEQVLGFNISSEDIDKINFGKMPVENIPKIAFNWYESPVMKY